MSGILILVSLSPAGLVSPKWGTVQTGLMRWSSRVYWSAPGCLAITCLTLWWEHSAVSPAKGPSPSARRHLTAASTTPWLMPLSCASRAECNGSHETMENHRPAVISLDGSDSSKLRSFEVSVVNCCFALLIYTQCVKLWATPKAAVQSEFSNVHCVQ